MRVLDGIIRMAMGVTIVVMMLVVMVVIAVSMLVRVLDTIEVFVQVEVGLIGILDLVLIAIDFHDRPFAAFRAVLNILNAAVADIHCASWS
jgi:hypothetical protein